MMISSNASSSPSRQHANHTTCHHQKFAHVNQAAFDQQIVNVKNYCLLHGLRFTALREQIYRLILLANKPVGAYDLLAQLQSVSDKVIAPPTVYRSLDFLLKHGLIHQLSSTNAFFACSQPNNNHVAAFLICQCCGDVQEFSNQPIQTMLSQVAQQSHFTIKSSVIELAGLCVNCSDADH